MSAKWERGFFPPHFINRAIEDLPPEYASALRKAVLTPFGQGLIAMCLLKRALEQREEEILGRVWKDSAGEIKMISMKWNPTDPYQRELLIEGMEFFQKKIEAMDPTIVDDINNFVEAWERKVRS
jgi:hypothetical protein